MFFLLLTVCSSVLQLIVLILIPLPTCQLSCSWTWKYHNRLSFSPRGKSFGFLCGDPLGTDFFTGTLFPASLHCIHCVLQKAPLRYLLDTNCCRACFSLSWSHNSSYLGGYNASFNNILFFNFHLFCVLGESGYRYNYRWYCVLSIGGEIFFFYSFFFFFSFLVFLF